MKILNNKLKSSINLRTENDFPVKGIEFIDITPLIINKDTFKEIIDTFVEKLKDKKIDYIIAPEARGFLIASAVAVELNVGLVPVRKKGKLPPTAVEKLFAYEKEYGLDMLELPKLVNTTYENKNFYIIDDIYATGNTIRSIKDTVRDLGGNIVGEGVIMNIKELNDNQNLFSIIDINEEI